MDKKERYSFTKEEIKELIKKYNVNSSSMALEEWAYGEFDLRHNGSLTTGKVGKTFIEIIELP